MSTLRLFVFILLFSVSFLHAQQYYELDKIVAEVEDQIILSSDIKNAILDLERQRLDAPPDAECSILEQLVINKLLSAQAKRDSIDVTEAELESDIELRIRNFINIYGSLETLEKVSGRTIFQIKQDFKDAIRDIKRAEKMQQKIITNVKVTPIEVKNYFNSIAKDSLPYYESEIEVGGITIYPKPSQDLDRFIQQELVEYRKQTLSGRVTFDFLIQTYSQDPGKSQNKGVYQVNINDKFWDPNFLSACFRLQNGEISLPVKSKFGYHLIQMVERRGTSATVKHLLRMSLPSENEIKVTVDKLKAIRQNILDKKITFQEAVNDYSEDDYAKFSGGFFTAPDGSSHLNYDQINPEVLTAVKLLKVGQISEPQEYQSRQGQLGYRILYLRTQTAPHQESLEHDYKKISDRVLFLKKKGAIDRWIQKKTKETNWRIIADYYKCERVSQWKK